MGQPSERTDRLLGIIKKKKVREAVQRGLLPDDELRFVLTNTEGWALIALHDRVIIAQVGAAATGSARGVRVTEYRYSEISGITTNTRISSASVALVTGSPSGGGLGPGGWLQATHEPNIMICSKAGLKIWEPHLNDLRGFIAEAHASPHRQPESRPDTQPGVPDLGSEPTAVASTAERLRELNALRDEGLIDEYEFGQKRRALLDDL